MSSAIAFAPLALLPVVLTVSIKSAAWVFRRTQLAWWYALAYGLMASVVNMAGMVTARWPGASIPPLWMAVIGLVVVLGLGGWYLGPRARTAQGVALGFRGGVALCLIAWALLCTVSVAIFFATVWIV